MLLDSLIEILITAMLVVSGVFGLVGSVGLMKLPDTMTRLHAPTKATTLGVGGALIASMLYFVFYADFVSFHEFMMTLFLLLTAPITANFIAKTQVHRGENPADLPPTGTDAGWATFDETADPSPKLKGEA